MVFVLKSVSMGGDETKSKIMKLDSSTQVKLLV